MYIILNFSLFFALSAFTCNLHSCLMLHLLINNLVCFDFVSSIKFSFKSTTLEKYVCYMYDLTHNNYQSYHKEFQSLLLVCISLVNIKYLNAFQSRNAFQCECIPNRRPSNVQAFHHLAFGRHSQ